MKKCIVLVGVLLFTFGMKAEEKSGLNMSVGADIVSSYIVRGIQFGHTSIQPNINFNIGEFSITAWGNADINDISYKEVDLSISYNISGLSLLITDYWLPCSPDDNEDTPTNYKYFTYKSQETNHTLEATVKYTLPVESFPLSLAWNTNFFGVIGKSNEKKVYSSYFEASYSFKVKNTELDAVIGIVPFKTDFYETNNNFSVTNISLKTSKEIKITDTFSLPLFSQLILNPSHENVFLVLGISF